VCEQREEFKLVKANAHFVMVHISTGSNKAHHRPAPSYVARLLSLGLHCQRSTSALTLLVLGTRRSQLKSAYVGCGLCISNPSDSEELDYIFFVFIFVYFGIIIMLLIIFHSLLLSTDMVKQKYVQAIDVLVRMLQ